MVDNVDFIRNIVTRMPDIRVLMTYIFIFAVIFGSVTAFVFSEMNLLTVDILAVIISIVSLYLIPSFLVGEISYWFVPSGRGWTYLTAIFNQVILFLFSVVILLTDEASDWQILFLGVIAIYIVNSVMIMVVRGRIDVLSVIVSLIYPLSVVSTFYFASDILIKNSKDLYFEIVLLILMPVVLLLLTFKLVDFLINSNVKTSVLDMSSTFLLKDPETVTGINGSVPAEVYHQALRIGKKDEDIFSIPWIHSGPAAGFGSGLLFPKISDENTFLLHIPSGHTLNLADASDVDKFREAPDADKSEKASKLFKIEKNGFTLWGRKYSGGKVIYVQNRDIDDYSPSIAYGLKEKYEDLCLIDLHNQLKDQADGLLQYMDKERHVLEEAVEEMIEQLDEAEMKDYEAGVSNKEEFCGLVEQVGDQKTCLLGINASCGMPVIHELEEKLDYDETMVFSTDTHEDPVDLNSVTEPQYDIEELRKTVKDADNSLKSTKAGLGERKVEDVGIMGMDGDYIVATVNLLLRLAPIFAVLYFVTIIAISLYVL